MLICRNRVIIPEEWQVLQCIVIIFPLAKSVYNKHMQDEQQPGWQFKPEEKPGATIQPGVPAQETHVATGGQDEVTWTASEFVEHDKSASWYLQFLLAVVVGLGLMYFITRDVVSVGILALLAVVFLIVARRKPRVLSYAVTRQGVRVGAKMYLYGAFKSFAVVDEGAIHSIMLLPLKRFMPSITLYYDPQDEARIIDMLGAALPEEERQQDSVDRFMRKIRF